MRYKTSSSDQPFTSIWMQEHSMPLSMTCDAVSYGEAPQKNLLIENQRAARYWRNRNSWNVVRFHSKHWAPSRVYSSLKVLSLEGLAYRVQLWFEALFHTSSFDQYMPRFTLRFPGRAVPITVLFKNQMLWSSAQYFPSIATQFLFASRKINHWCRRPHKSYLRAM